MLLEVRKLNVNYGSLRALDNVSLNVAEGEIVAMIGPNGAGKSTTLKAISGIIKATGGEIKSGDIFFVGDQIKNTPPYELVKKGISLVPEDRRVFPTMTVQENLEMGAFSLSSREIIKKAMDNVFTLFPILRERKKQVAGTLSVGEQQMLAMGRALMIKPKLLLLDEPSLGLSPNYVEAVFNKISEINSIGTTVLLVEQNARMALEYSHRAYVFEIGKIAFTDNSKNLIENEKIKKSFLGIKQN